MATAVQKTIHYQQKSKHRLIITHFICAIALISALLISRIRVGCNLISQPVKTIGIIWAVQIPAVVLACSQLRSNPQACSVWRAIGRGLLSIPAGALVNAFGAIVFGAPLALEYAARTLHWSLLMSSLTVVPAATVLGTSWSDWQRIFAHFKIVAGVDYILCFPAYGAVIGSWFGAWPMPLDWERPWQDWPICVTYGAIGGYLVGLIISSILDFFKWRDFSGKMD